MFRQRVLNAEILGCTDLSVVDKVFVFFCYIKLRKVKLRYVFGKTARSYNLILEIRSNLT